ncbi:MAG: hypothetical protein JXM70_06615 [Pirellulales bacterium]|nr:hypothetical protein [Pirellulales bacterium]
MNSKKFDISVGDTQGVCIEPLAPERFDFEAFAQHEEETAAICRAFWDSKTGVAVTRRFRVPEVYSFGCGDMQRSLQLQLAALQVSTQYAADIPNYLEPWYGIGTVASCFGAEYIWAENQAPAIEPPFGTLSEALDYEPITVEKTSIGRHTIEMIEYFMETTGGRLPMSPTDTQSPWDITMMLVETSSLLMETIDNAGVVRKLVDHVADLLIEFNGRQVELIGENLVLPGHGFASSREFRGLGMSDDSSCMISPGQYTEFCAAANSRVGHVFGGPCFHSCGNWSKWLPAVMQTQGLLVVDGAFSPQTDPNPNPPRAFAESLAGSGVVLNARIVGDVDEIERVTRELWLPGMKLIVVTYCRTPEEQAEAYERVHEICV